MTAPCITCGRECNNPPCQHCAERPKPRTVGFLDVPLPAATPPTLEAALALPEVQALVEAVGEAADVAHKAYVAATMEAVNAGASHPLIENIEKWRVRCLRAETKARGALRQAEGE